MPTSTNQTKAERREAARAAALALKAKQDAADKRARLITLSVLGVVVAALLAVVVFLFVNNAQNEAASKEAAQVSDTKLADVKVAPAAATDDGGIAIGKDRAAGGTTTDGVPTVAIYIDYMCPYCGQFEAANKGALEQLITGGAANFQIHPLSLLDRASSGTQYSTRAASASAWVAEKAPEHWLDFHEALFANQPKENSTGLTDEKIAEIAKSAGVPADVAAGITSLEARKTFGQWVYSASNFATTDGQVTGTPTIKIDGEAWKGDWTDPTALAQAIHDATKLQ